MVKNLPVIQETRVWSLGWEGPLEKKMATHSSILTWEIPWTEEPGRLQSMGSQRIRHDWATNSFTLPEPIILPFCSSSSWIYQPQQSTPCMLSWFLLVHIIQVIQVPQHLGVNNPFLLLCGAILLHMLAFDLEALKGGGCKTQEASS